MSLPNSPPCPLKNDPKNSSTTGSKNGSKMTPQTPYFDPQKSTKNNVKFIQKLVKITPKIDQNPLKISSKTPVKSPLKFPI